MKPTFQRCGVVAVFSVLFAAAILLVPQSGLAQLLQGTIDGNITDSSQAVVSSATVSAKNEGTGFVRDSKTNAEGAYVLSSLPPGNYTLTVKAAGFESYVKTGIVVAANETTRSDIALTVGQVSESITVAAQASTLQTDRADVHTDLNTHLLNDLPMALGRNFQQILAVMTPGVSPPQSGQSFGANAARLVGYSVNGASSVTNSTRIDGTSSTNFNSPMAPRYSPALEAIDTVNVVTGSYDAEQGIAGGAAVNITTKSGTNSLHGSLFEYHSDRNLQAYSWGVHGGLSKPEYINNQFGGTIGGPIKKDKLFYFVSYQGTYVNIGNTLYAENPTAAMKEGLSLPRLTLSLIRRRATATERGEHLFRATLFRKTGSIPASRLSSALLPGLNRTRPEQALWVLPETTSAQESAQKHRTNGTPSSIGMPRAS